MALLVLVGCFHSGIQPRSGRIASPGTVRGQQTATFFTFAPARTTGVADGDANFGALASSGGDPIGTLAIAVGSLLQFGVSYGMAPRLELGVLFGPEFAVEVRTAIKEEARSGSTLAIVATGGGSILRGHDLRAGVDASLPLGRGIELIIDAYLGHAGHRYSATYDNHDLMIVRDEVRLTAAIGIGQNGAYFSLVPFVVLRSDEPHSIHWIGCDDCSSAVVFRSSGWGASVTTSLEWR